jgi:xylulokinase
VARLIGIDIGTSSAKAVAIDEKGALLGSASREYPLSVPQSGWAEQNPEDWWQAAMECLEELKADQSDGIGLTGQMHGSVFLDSDGKVIRPALLWCDQRTGAECAEIEAAVGGERLRQITGNPALPGFQLPKTLWLRRHEPEAFSRLAKVLLPKDFIRFRLNGLMVSDVSDASGVGALDVRKRSWSPEVLEALGLSMSLFPDVVESAAQTGSWKGVPLAAGGGDQAAAAVGTGAVTPGLVSMSLGTSGVAFEAVDAVPSQQTDSVHDFCHANGRWHRMGVMISCGGAIRWCRDALYPGQGYEVMNAEASQVPPGCEGLTFAPYLSGERCPFVDPHVRGAFAGLGLHHTRGHMARAVFEGVTYGLAACLDLMKDGARPDKVRVTGGGVKSEFWVQMIADTLGRPCEKLESDEGPAYGAAILGGLSAGVWKTVEEACSNVIRPAGTTAPQSQAPPEALERTRRLYPALRVWTE